jgi:hypothetical protein
MRLDSYGTGPARPPEARGRAPNPTVLDARDKDILNQWEIEGRRINTEIERGTYDATALDRALSKLPRYDGKIAYKNQGYRGGTANLSSFTPQGAANRWRLGKETRYQGYTSAATSPEAAAGPLTRFGTDVAVAIKTSQSADLRPEATMPEQFEIVIGRNVPLKTTHVERNPLSNGQEGSRLMVLANTRNSSPVRQEELHEEWLRWARGGAPRTEGRWSFEDAELAFARIEDSPSPERRTYWREQIDRSSSSEEPAASTRVTRGRTRGLA